MFQDALIESGGAGPRRSAAGIPLAVALHAAVLAALAGVSAWRTGDPPEPSVPVFFTQPAGPPPAPAGAPGPSPRDKRVAHPRPPTAARFFVAPVEIPELPVSSDEGSEASAPGSDTSGAGIDGAVGDGGGGGGTNPGGLPSLAPEEPYRTGGDVRPPELLRRIEPAYPEAARKVRIEGVVILEAVISAAGAVEEVRVLRSANPLLDGAAADAVAQWRYRPATLNGRTVRVYLTVTVSFKLH